MNDLNPLPPPLTVQFHQVSQTKSGFITITNTASQETKTYKITHINGEKFESLSGVDPQKITDLVQNIIQRRATDLWGAEKITLSPDSRKFQYIKNGTAGEVNRQLTGQEEALDNSECQRLAQAVQRVVPPSILPPRSVRRGFANQDVASCYVISSVQALKPLLDELKEINPESPTIRLIEKLYQDGDILKFKAELRKDPRFNDVIKPDTVFGPAQKLTAKLLYVLSEESDLVKDKLQIKRPKPTGNGSLYAHFISLDRHDPIPEGVEKQFETLSKREITNIPENFFVQVDNDQGDPVQRGDLNFNASLGKETVQVEVTALLTGGTGHATCYRKIEGKWYHFNDSNVEEVEEPPRSANYIGMWTKLTETNS